MAVGASGFSVVPSVPLWDAQRDGSSTVRVHCSGMLHSTPGSSPVPAEDLLSASGARHWGTSSVR